MTLLITIALQWSEIVDKSIAQRHASWTKIINKHFNRFPKTQNQVWKNHFPFMSRYGWGFLKDSWALGWSWKSNPLQPTHSDFQPHGFHSPPFWGHRQISLPFSVNASLEEIYFLPIVYQALGVDSGRAFVARFEWTRSVELLFSHS